MSALLIAVPVLPLLAAALSGLVGRHLPWRGGELFVCATALTTGALVSLYGKHQTLKGSWFSSGGLRLDVGLELNGLTWLMALVVAGVALFVGIYSLGYLRGARERPRFFAELAFFVGAMLTLVLSSSLVLLFIAWEAIGIASYLLIGFHYDQSGAPAAATKALLMTRLADMGLLLGWLWLLLELRTTDIGAVLAAVSQGAISPGILTPIALLLLLGAVGKSAQLPLTAWLPDAMVAPTPVSALIHSATLVAAGVFLLLRLYPLFAAAPRALVCASWVGAATALFCAIAAAGEMDLKRVLAWSTSSHLGGMMLAVGLGGPLAAALQLVIHASFKSTLFLSAGMIDQQTGTRDLRQLGGLGYLLPLTTLAFLLGALSLAGLQPFFFTSSDDVMLAALGTTPAAAYLMLVTIFLSGLYIARAGIAVFAGNKPNSRLSGHESNVAMLIGMMALASATALSTVMIVAVPHVLAFGAKPATPWNWRLYAGVAGIAGLLLGGAHARRHHAASVLGRLPGLLMRTLATVTELPSQIVFTSARAVARLEQALDTTARGAADFVWRLALGSLHLERQEFGAGGDHVAEMFQRTGEQLRSLASGKLYLYTLGLFLWSLIVIVAGVVILIH